MKEVWELIVGTTIEVFNNVKYFVKNNLVAFANVLNLIVPYVMYFCGQEAALDRDKISVGGEIIIPLIFILVIFYLKSIANKIGKGITIPLPNKRFTQVDDDGEVSIENSRIQELILYLADLEDWMQRKGLL